MNKINKIMGNLALVSALALGAGTIVANQPTNVQARAHHHKKSHKKHRYDAWVKAHFRRYRTASTKDYQHLAKLATKPGMHYLKKPIYAFNFCPSDNQHDIYDYPSGKLTDFPVTTGAYSKIIAAGTLKGKAVVLAHDNNSSKAAVPIRDFTLPRGMKLKPNAHPVYAYNGHLKGSEAGYNVHADMFDSDYDNEPAFINQENTIYTNHKSTKHRVTMDYYGELGGFVIGNYTIKMNDGNNYYPIFYHASDWIDYIPEKDIDQFEPAKVSVEDYTLNGSKITPRKKSFCDNDFAG